MANSAFDPYHEWLGIAPHERPINHYRLLGLRLFASDAKEILAAADERMLHVRKFQSGRRSNESQRMLNELAAAKTCLLDADTKATYDAVLQGQLAAARPSNPPPLAALHVAPAPPPAPPPVASVAKPQAATDMGLINDAVSHSDPYSEPTPFYLQPWFPVLLVAGVMLLVICGWTLTLLIRDARREAAQAPPVENNLTTSVPSDKTETPSDDDDTIVDQGLIRQDAGGEILLSVEKAEVEGSSRPTTSGASPAISITSVDDRLLWNIHVDEPGAFRIEATYSTSSENAGGKFRLQTQDRETKSISTRDTGGATNFTSERIGFIWLTRKGKHQLTLVPESVPEGHPLINLQSLRLIPVAGTGGQ